MDTETVNRIITEITNRLGVGYSVFSDAVTQYAQAKATESLIFSVALLVVALLILFFLIFAIVLAPNVDIDNKVEVFIKFMLVILLLAVPGVIFLTGYINWSNAPQGMFLQEIMQAVK